jgi:hypothetical protein
MPELLHKVAIYYDEDGARQTIRAKQLMDPAEFAAAKLKDLYDESELFQLFPRNSATPHFFETGTKSGTQDLFRGETDPAHNKRVDELAKNLVELSIFSLALKGSSKDGEKIEILYKIPKYNWGAEVHRIMSADAIVRHDLFGKSQELGMSIRRPWIAIEVIYTHYPEEQAFEAMLAVSKSMPFIVIFDLVEKKNTFLKIDFSLQQLQIRPWTYWIKNGKVWKGNIETGINTSAHLETEINRMLAGWMKKSS